MANLSSYRKDKGLTLRKFSERCGLSTSYLCEIEGGKCPSFNAVKKIHKATNGEVSFDDWISEEDA